jgi:hypothetical protein
MFAPPPKKNGEKNGDFGSNYCHLGRKDDYNIGFQEKRHFFRRQ